MSNKKERDLVRPHVIDGIEEYDNPLPSWWVWLFNLCIVFSIAYLIWYHVLGKPGLAGELLRDREEYAETQRAQQGILAAAGPEELLARLKEPARIEEGKGIYVTNCAPCHGAAGEGVVGPNLTDHNWIHGGLPEQIIGTITNGVPDKGMVAWQSLLGAQKIEAVTAYILTLKDSHPANPKAPQGDAEDAP